MGVRELTVLISAVALCAMGAIPGAGHGPACCDVNGDHHVDVLDVQTVIGAVLAVGMPNRLTDVNGDGRTDVLDLHLTLNRVREPEHEHGVPPDCFSLAAQGSSLPIFKPARCARWREVFAAVSPPKARQAFLETGPGLASCRTERYLYRLTPHAPPSCA